MATAVDVHDSFAAHFEHLRALRPGWHFEMCFAFQRRHINFAAQGRTGERDWHLAIQIVAFTLKDFVFLDVDDHIKVAWWTTANAGFPVA